MKIFVTQAVLTTDELHTYAATMASYTRNLS